VAADSIGGARAVMNVDRASPAMRSIAAILLLPPPFT
jgi:hypothetical protein